MPEFSNAQILDPRPRCARPRERTQCFSGGGAPKKGSVFSDFYPRDLAQKGRELTSKILTFLVFPRPKLNSKILSFLVSPLPKLTKDVWQPRRPPAEDRIALTPG